MGCDWKVIREKAEIRKALNMIFDRNTILRPAEPEMYRAAAEEAMQYINSRRVRDEHGTRFSLEDAQASKPYYYDEICVYSGSSGIILFLLSLYDATGKTEYLEEAEDCGRYLQYRWNEKRELAKNFSKFAFTTGYAGVSVALLQLAAVSGNKSYLDTVHAIADAILAEAKKPEDGIGYTWSTYPGIVGNAGTILYLLSAGKQLGRPELISFAAEAAKWFLDKARTYPQGGRYYLGVDPKYFGAGDDYIDPNFPMGTAGIGYMFLKVYEAVGDRTFLDATDGIKEFIAAAASFSGDRSAALLPHALPDRPDVFYLGYCHGPVGTCRYFDELYKITGDLDDRDWELRLARGVLAAGAPENHSEGYWYTANLCCGTAGMVDLFLGLWAESKEVKWLHAARRASDHLLGWARDAEKGITWNLALDRVSPKAVTAPIGLYDGAAGIGWVLLQMYTALTGHFRALRSIDDPFPEKA